MVTHEAYLPLDESWAVFYDEAPAFLQWCDAHVRDVLIARFLESEGCEAFNGTTICINGIMRKERRIVLANDEFFSFFFYNVIGRYCAENSDSIERLARADNDLRCVLECLRDRYIQVREDFESISGVINSHSLPNTLAVSVLLYDAEGRFLLVKRSQKVAVSQGFLSTTCTGAVEVQDVVSIGADEVPACFADLLCACASREMQEELGIQMASSAFQVTHLFMGRSKLQPVALVEAAYPGSISEDDLILLRSSMDCNETVELYLVHRDVLGQLPSEFMTEAARFQIKQYSTDNVGERIRV